MEECTFRFDFDSAHCLLYKCCIGFLAYVFNTNTSGVSLEDISVVRDFSDVFQNELPGLRTLEFAIDLTLGTRPLSLPLYKTAPTKLKVLKIQL